MPQKQILLVDDSHFFIQVAQEFLKRSGHVILTARSGREALAHIENMVPDVILMDYYMNDMNGDECCRSIKANVATAKVPVIMLTSAGNAEDVERCKQAGCDDYLTKPVDKMELLAKVKKFIEIPVRQFKRAAICIPAVYLHDGEAHDGTIFSISEGGLFLKGESLLDKGALIDLRFTIPHVGGEIRVKGAVAWNTSERRNIPSAIGPGFGVSFLSLDEGGRAAIRIYVGLGDYLV